MQRSEYYRDLKQSANEHRDMFGLQTPRVLRSDVGRILKHYGIKVTQWPMPGISGQKMKSLRGAYMPIFGEPHILIDRHLPDDPYVFTLAHELKHHLTDRHLAVTFCHDGNMTEAIEIGAEVFAAELIYPDSMFQTDMLAAMTENGGDPAKSLVALKHSTQTTLSYAGMKKKMEFHGFAAPGSLSGVKLKKLEIEMFGEPLHIQLLKRRRELVP